MSNRPPGGEQAVDRRLEHDRGAGLVEYALLVALIALVCFVAVAFLGGQTDNSFSRIGDSVTNA